MAERAPSAPITTSALTSIVLPSGLSHKFQKKKSLTKSDELHSWSYSHLFLCADGDTRTTRESPQQATRKHVKLMSLILLVKGKEKNKTRGKTMDYRVTKRNWDCCLFCWQECKENQTSPNQLKEKMVKITMLAEPIP